MYPAKKEAKVFCTENFKIKIFFYPGCIFWAMSISFFFTHVYKYKVKLCPVLWIWHFKIDRDKKDEKIEHKLAVHCLGQTQIPRADKAPFSRITIPLMLSIIFWVQRICGFDYGYIWIMMFLCLILSWELRSIESSHRW